MLRDRALVCLTAALFLVPGIAHDQMAVEEVFAQGQPPVVIAHRSAELGGLPENSLAWIQYAIDRGIDAVHINPQLTADDHYVLMHDNTLNRTTDVETVYPSGPPSGPTRKQRGGLDYVRDYTLDEIGKLRLVNGSDDARHPVPTLGDALDLIDGRAIVLLGLKSYEVDSLAAALDGRLTGNLLLFELYYSGTDQSKLRDMTEASGIGACVVLFRSRDYLSDLEDIADQIGPALKLVSVGSSRLTPEFTAKVESLNLRLSIGGWNGPEDYALAHKADPGPWRDMLDRSFAAETDKPDLLLKSLGR